MKSKGFEKDILAFGYAGEAGVNKIVKDRKEDLKDYFKTSFLDKIITDLSDTSKMFEIASETLEPWSFVKVGEQGILASLYTVAKQRNKGLVLRLKDIPVKQSTIEICEFYSLDPYRLLSDMGFIFCDNALRTSENLGKKGFKTVHIGYLTGALDKIIIDKEEIQYIDRPSRDEIYKVMEEL